MLKATFREWGEITEITQTEFLCEQHVVRTQDFPKVALVLISPVAVLARTRKNDTKYADEWMSLLRLKYHQLGSFNNRDLGSQF